MGGLKGRLGGAVGGGSRGFGRSAGHMRMYACVYAVRPKCNGFMAPAFAVRMVSAYRTFAVPAVMPHHNVICRSLSAACMQTLHPGSTSLICLAFADPTFGKRAQVSAAPSFHDTESGGGASEQTAVCAVDRLSLDVAIAKVSNHDESDALGGNILAAAVALRDSSGRDR